MIPERHMKRARRLDNGEAIGYLHLKYFNVGGKATFIPVIQTKIDDGHYEDVPIDPDSVEDVAVKPIKNDARPGSLYYERPYKLCPNCELEFVEYCDYNLKYCPNCGQRIDWSGEDA